MVNAILLNGNHNLIIMLRSHASKRGHFQPAAEPIAPHRTNLPNTRTTRKKRLGCRLGSFDNPLALESLFPPSIIALHLAAAITAGSSEAWRLTRRTQQSLERPETKTGINWGLDSQVRCSDWLCGLTNGGTFHFAS